jgi:hypothetical protein
MAQMVIARYLLEPLDGENLPDFVGECLVVNHGAVSSRSKRMGELLSLQRSDLFKQVGVYTSSSACLVVGSDASLCVSLHEALIQAMNPYHLEV